MMRVSDFHYDLPEALIALYPRTQRTTSRLMCLDGNSGELKHKLFSDLPELLQPGDLLVLNNTRVIPARLYGAKSSGGKIELLVERILDEHKVLAHIRASKSPKPGTHLQFDDKVSAIVLGRQGDLFELEFQGEQPVLAILKAIGHIPLPPYIHRPDNAQDWSTYQTVYGSRDGAVAAPTAGLHFDEALLAKLAKQGIEHTFVTLHVGAGTFQNPRVENVLEHQMHAERIEISEEACHAILATKARGGKVIAVGTTSARCLETAAQTGKLQPFSGETRLFIYPGYQFQCVDSLITNFHLSESTLLMLVCAFAGYEQVMNAYQEAIKHQYRFFSYGDAMLLSRQT